MDEVDKLLAAAAGSDGPRPHDISHYAYGILSRVYSVEEAREKQIDGRKRMMGSEEVIETPEKIILKIDIYTKYLSSNCIFSLLNATMFGLKGVEIEESLKEDLKELQDYPVQEGMKPPAYFIEKVLKAIKEEPNGQFRERSFLE